MKPAYKFLLLLAIPAVSWAGDSSLEALNLLKKMYAAPKKLNYQGTFVYSHDGKIESMKIFHSVGKEGERERVYHLNGSSREVVREKNQTTCIITDNKSVMVNKDQGSQNILLLLSKNIESLKDNYHFVMGKDDRIAGRLSKTVLVKPKDNYRYGRKLWIDTDTSLLLSSALLNENDYTIERIMFINIKVVDKIPTFLLKPTMSGKEFTWHRELSNANATDIGVTNWVVTRMPNGFRSAKHHMRHVSTETDSAKHSHSHSDSVEHIVLSDGLASVSVYVERLAGQNAKFIGTSFMGAVNVYGTVVSDYQVTVVGEVPQSTVKLIASSVQYVKKH